MAENIARAQALSQFPCRNRRVGGMNTDAKGSTQTFIQLIGQLYNSTQVICAGLIRHNTFGKTDL